MRGVTTGYQYDGSQMLTETTNGSTVQYLWGPGGLVRRDGEWPAADGLGNTRFVTNGSQSVTSTQLPDAYGQTVSSGGSTSLPYLWGASSGYRSDLDAGLVQVGARYYDRDSGRFVTRDTDLDEAPYAYCDGDPINYSDPSGHTASPPPLIPPNPNAPPPGNPNDLGQYGLGPFGSGSGTTVAGPGSNSGTAGAGATGHPGNTSQTTGGAANPTAKSPVGAGQLHLTGDNLDQIVIVPTCA